MSYIPSQLKNYFKNNSDNTGILDQESDNNIEKKSKNFDFNPYPYLKSIPSKLNLGEKKHNILQLTSKDSITSGKPITWIISLSNSTVQLIDDYKLTIFDNGFYHLIGQLCITSFCVDNIENFTVDLQVNYKSISLVYYQIPEKQIQTIFINEILSLEKDDIITISLGNVSLVINDNNEILNKLTILKL